MAGRVGTRENPIVIRLKQGFTADDLGTAVRGEFQTIEGLHQQPGESHMLIKNAGNGSLEPAGLTQPKNKGKNKGKSKSKAQVKVAAKKQPSGKKK